MFTNDQFHEILFPQLLFYHKIAIIHNSLLTIYNNTPLLFGMKPMKSLTLHKKNQRSLTIEINPTPKQRLHHSNPKPRPDHQRSSLLNTTSYKNESSTTKHQPSKNFIRLKGDLNTVGLGLGTGLSSGTGLGLPAHIHKSFGDLKNDSLAKIISKRQPSVSKDSCPKIKQKDRKPRQRLSIDIFNKMSPDQKSYTNSTKAISRRRSTLISKMKSQVSQEFVDHSIFPQSNKEVLQRAGHYLSQKEIDELLQIETVHYMNKKQRLYVGQENGGFDDKKGFYLSQVGDHITYRFQIISKLGKGSFGEVLKVFDHKKKEQVALKIIRNRKTPNSQALIQYGILKTLNSGGASSQNIVKVYQAFRFRNHFCMTFELLSLNLYDLLKSHKFAPFSSQLIRRLSIQILSSLIYLRRKNIIHCDIKPENVLLKQIDKSGIKLIDFGSSCYSDERMYSYIQSRYYRAPEVILGYEYSFPIDMWSFGCVAAQLKLTYPLFGGQDEKEQVGLISEVIGLPDKKFYSRTERGELYFEKGTLKDREGEVIIPHARPLKDLFEDSDFIAFLQKIFVWDPIKRINPIDALRHNWILKGIPQEIRSQHLEYLNEEEAILNGTRDKGQSSTLSQQILSRNAR